MSLTAETAWTTGPLGAVAFAELAMVTRYHNGLYAERRDNGIWTVRLSPNGETDGEVIGRVQKRSSSRWEARPLRLSRFATKSTLAEGMDHLKASHDWLKGRR